MDPFEDRNVNRLESRACTGDGKISGMPLEKQVSRLMSIGLK